MEIIFQHQLTHHRILIHSIASARQLWKQNYRWFPVAQNCVYSHMDRVYKETREKYGDKLFMELVQERRLNERVYKLKHEVNSVDSEAKETVFKCGILNKKCYI